MFGKDPVGGICYSEFQGLNSPCPFCTNQIILENKGKPYEWEFHNPILKADYHITDQIIRWPDGRDVRLEVAIDITERRRIGDKLKEQTRFLMALMESIPVPVFYKDVNHTYVGCNEAFNKYLGRSRDEIVGKTVCELHPKELAEVYQRQDKELFQHPGIQAYEANIKTANGNIRDVVLHKATFNDANGNVDGLIGVIMDITERKSMERQLRKAQRLESIATLAGGIAHDFNNLLTIISGYCELGLTGKEKGDPGYEELAIVMDAAGRGADLVKQILTFSRDVETNPKPINLNHQVQKARKLLYKTIPKMIQIETRLADDLNIVMADPTQIEQILLNLAVNARDAMPGNGKLTFETENCVLDENYCRLHRDVRPGEYVALSISDTGKGMDREIQDRIFEPFFSTKKPGEGTGLGLAMVFGIVKKHDGHITCHSELGDGTTFRIYLPVIKEGKTKLEVSTTREYAALGTETILLVDDEELIADLGKRILTQSGYRVLTANNGKEALQSYRQQKDEINLVILDMIMPMMGGKECLQELLKIDPYVKVLFASGYASGGRPRDATENGAKGFVSKPFNVQQLTRAVREAIDVF